ncbi:MAG: ATP-binding cassette domain-containing protein [Candidatus Bathyarchaeia archaeon]
MEPLLEAKDIHKFFGKVHALRGVNFQVNHNEIVGLVGDNGAGKSTLIKILSGVFPPDKGSIYWRGEKIDKLTVQKARELGIVTVFQERALVERQPLWRNIFLGRELTNKLGFLKVKEQKLETEKLMKTLGFTSSAVTPDSIVKYMSGGEKQGVAIARSLYFNAELIILDEPTVGLSLFETQKVLDFVREIKERGKSCIFITHNIYHVYPVADRFVVLDRGKCVAEFFKKDIDLNTLADKLVAIARGG